MERQREVSSSKTRSCAQIPRLITAHSQPSALNSAASRSDPASSIKEMNSILGRVANLDFNGNYSPNLRHESTRRWYHLLAANPLPIWQQFLSARLNCRTGDCAPRPQTLIDENLSPTPFPIGGRALFGNLDASWQFACRPCNVFRDPPARKPIASDMQPAWLQACCEILANWQGAVLMKRATVGKRGQLEY
jgi:hypothetical protein